VAHAAEAHGLRGADEAQALEVLERLQGKLALLVCAGRTFAEDRDQCARTLDQLVVRRHTSLGRSRFYLCHCPELLTSVR
jgi:hypothetical protein